MVIHKQIVKNAEVLDLNKFP